MPKSALPNKKTLGELTQAEVDQRQALTPAELAAVEALEKAILSLPPLICCHVDEDGLVIQKRVTHGYAHGLKTVPKRSICFDNRV